MQTIKGAKVLLICPNFFGYDKEIKSGLERLGANVTLYDDRPGNSFFVKVLIRLNKNWLSSRISEHYNRIIQENKEQQFDYVFFVNPEAVSTKEMKALKEIFPNAKYIMYMWDAFSNKRKSVELLPYFSEKFTFDPRDAEKYGIHHRPLFFIPIYNATQGPIVYDLSFIGTAHSDRYHLANKIVDCLPIHYNSRLYFFLQSKKLFFSKKLMEKDFRAVKLKDINFKSINHSDAASIIKQSQVVLDINHPAQQGLTMRTLETLGSQRKLITTNKNIVEYDFYNHNNIQVIDRDNLNIDVSFWTTEFAPYSSDIIEKYSLRGWLKEIFGWKQAA